MAHGGRVALGQVTLSTYRSILITLVGESGKECDSQSATIYV